MFIDKYKNADGDGYTYDGGYCENEESVYLGILGFCGCGMPDEAIRYVRDCLRYIADLQDTVLPVKGRDQRDIAYKRWENAGKMLFVNEGCEYFMYYYLDNLGFTEHGGSVPGWLSDEGRAVLSDLDILVARYDAEETEG